MSKKKKRNKKQYDYSGVKKTQVDSLLNICPLNTYRRINPDIIRPLKLLSDSLLDKFDSILLVTSGLASDYAIMVNGNRIDFKDSAIDQMPFGIICSGSEPLTSGSLIQHGDWLGRTTYPPDSYWTHLSNSGIGNYYPLDEMPIEESGSVNDLKIQSQHDSINDLVTNLKKTFKK
jgi:hypothetical protein